MESIACWQSTLAFGITVYYIQHQFFSEDGLISYIEFYFHRLVINFVAKLVKKSNNLFAQFTWFLRIRALTIAHYSFTKQKKLYHMSIFP